MSETYFPNGIETEKKDESVYYYARPAIGWTLECETGRGLGRKQIIDQLGY
jgi:hypothetical protein